MTEIDHNSVGGRSKCAPSSYPAAPRRPSLPVQQHRSLQSQAASLRYSPRNQAVMGTACGLTLPSFQRCPRHTSSALWYYHHTQPVSGGSTLNYRLRDCLGLCTHMIIPQHQSSPPSWIGRVGCRHLSTPTRNIKRQRLIGPQSFQKATKTRVCNAPKGDPKGCQNAHFIIVYTQFLVCNAKFIVFNAKFIVVNAKIIVFTHRADRNRA